MTLLSNIVTLDWLDPRVERLPDAPGCWIWTGARFHGGYGQITLKIVNGRTPVGAHRVIYLAFIGAIPECLHVLHSCSTPPCVRPSHLYAGTREQNMQERTAQGRYHRLDEHARLAVYKAIVESGEDPRQVALAYGISSRHAYRIAGSQVRWAQEVPA